MLRISEIVKHFDNIKALDGVSLSIGKGEFFGLLGPNGAGKTTLMNIIVGYTQPDSGIVSFKDKLIEYNDVSSKQNIGYVPQEIALYQELTAVQNMQIFGSLYNLDKSELDKNIDEALDLVKLKDRRKDPVKEFSGGMKRRLNIAVSILHKPSLLLCDEPTVGVDPQSRNAIFEMLQELNRQSITIIYTTHHMEEAERLCSRLAIIDYGKIIAQGTLGELVNLLEHKETIKISKNHETSGKLDQLKTIGTVTELDDIYEIIPGDGFDRNSQIFKALEDSRIAPELIELSRASLEDVFLNLTGRTLRD